MRNLLRRHRREIALVIGNGINRYGLAERTNSWSHLLVSLAQAGPAGSGQLQREFCQLMAAWRSHDHHRWIVGWAQRADAPVLTTNFARVLADAGGLSLRRTTDDGFTDRYPWESYYGGKDITDPSAQFGVWHVNGMEHYPRSVRLGLSHHMGPVERARRWMHRGGERRLFSAKGARKWHGARSWLHVIFNAPLLIFGLALEQDEVFPRWLLVERAKYFRKFPGRRKIAWYVHVGPLSQGKEIFLKAVGIIPQSVATFDDIYGRQTWR